MTRNEKNLWPRRNFISNERKKKRHFFLSIFRFISISIFFGFVKKNVSTTNELRFFRIEFEGFRKSWTFRRPLDNSLGLRIRRSSGHSRTRENKTDEFVWKLSIFNFAEKIFEENRTRRSFVGKRNWRWDRRIVSADWCHPNQRSTLSRKLKTQKTFLFPSSMFLLFFGIEFQFIVYRRRHQKLNVFFIAWNHPIPK